ncbi:K(+)/H(+) antiporter [Podila epigama]|nr:K(+)/H(+) antiporter [Podila epigama]
MSTTVGFITVCAAAAGDIVAWLLLALLVSLIHATTPIMPLYVILMSIGVCLVLVYAVRPLLMYCVRVTHSEEEPSQKMIAVTLVIVLSTAFVTHIIGIHSIFGGFLVGLLIPHDSGFAEGLTRRIEDLVGVYFLPIFFACSGFKTQVSLLNNAETWGMVVLVVLVSWFGKMLGCTTAARYNGMTWRESLSIGFLMNCKGLVEYIILNIGHDSGVISDRTFVIMIAMCLILTMIATPFVGYLYPLWYQKKLEVQREAERKGLARPKVSEPVTTTTGAKKGGFFSGIAGQFRKRKSGKLDGHSKEEMGEAAHDGEHFEDLDSIRIHASDREAGLSDDDFGAPSIKRPVVKNSVMFCIDKTSNAPGVMTLLQLFSGNTNASLNQRRSKLRNHAHGAHHKKQGGKEEEEPYKGILQPSIDISDPLKHHRLTRQQSENDVASEQKVFAIRLLHISERTSAAMLTASRCMDRLYKDTVMMMVMAFAKLNSVPLKPLVAISTDTAQSTVAQDILDRAIDLDVGWVVFPWNSSHLTDLPMPSTPAVTSTCPGGPLFASGSHLQPGLTLTAASTSVSHTAPTTPAVNTSTLEKPFQSGVFSESSTDLSKVFPYNITRYFDHEEAQKIASGGHVNLSETGESHRTSIASNTKVLSKLIAATGKASKNVSTAVLVDRGLGLAGGVEHIVVPLLGGSDDYDTLCLASCLSKNTKCFVTVLRISSRQQQQPFRTTVAESQQQSTSQTHLSPPQHRLAHQQQPHTQTHTRWGSGNEKSVPPSPDVFKSQFIGGVTHRITDHNHQSEDLSQLRQRPMMNQVPKDDNQLLSTFFASKPKFQWKNRSHAARASESGGNAAGAATNGDGNVDGTGIDSDHDDDEDDTYYNGSAQVEEGAKVLNFQEMSDAILWARSCLTAQDLIVMGHDTPSEFAFNNSGPGLRGRTNSQQQLAFSRVPSIDERSSLLEGGGGGGSGGSVFSGTGSGFTSGRVISLSPTQVSHASPPSILERRGLTLSPRSDRLLPTMDQTNDNSMPRSSLEVERPGRSEVIQKSGRSGSRHRIGSRSIRSLSRGRKPTDTPGAASGTSGGGAGASAGGAGGESSSPLTTCQLILGMAADQLLQSGVVCSLIAVRSRWSPVFLGSTTSLRRKSSVQDMHLVDGDASASASASAVDHRTTTGVSTGSMSDANTGAITFGGDVAYSEKAVDFSRDMETPRSSGEAP